MHTQGTGIAGAVLAEPTMWAIGVAFVIGSMWLATLVICRAVKRPTRDAMAAYDLGEQMGRDRGYEEGRRVARPVVVPMPPACPCRLAGASKRETADVR